MKIVLDTLVCWQSRIIGQSSLFTGIILFLSINGNVYSQTQYSCGNKKVYVCHKGKNTLCIAEEAVQAHLDHGDYLGKCGSSGCSLTVSGNGGEKTCSNPFVIISATSNATNVIYSWSGPGGFTSDLVCPSVSLPGKYTVTVTDPVTECQASDSVTVTENTTNPDIVASVNGILKCTNSFVTIAASSNTPELIYRWTGPNSYVSTRKIAITSFPGEYTVIAVNPLNGCESSYSINVLNEDTAPSGVMATVSGILTCQQNTVRLAGSSAITGVNYNWLGPNGFISNEQNPLVSISGKYILNVTNPDNGCTTSTNVLVQQDTIHPEGLMALVTGELTCKTSIVTLNGQSATSGVVFSWTGPYSFSSSSPAPSASKPGIYTLTATNSSNGCISQASVEVKQNIAGPANLTATVSDTLRNNVLDVMISASSTTNGVKYFWNSANGFNFSGASAIANKPGEYRVSATNPVNECSDSTKVFVIQN